MIHKKDGENTPALRLVAWELTRSCVLNCRHCRASATREKAADEFTYDECRRVLDSLAGMGSCIVILTGGEPMLRDDLQSIASYGSSIGLRMVMATCGTLLDRDICEQLRESGIARISLSLDGATAQNHDYFRGVKGAFDSLMRGIEAARDTGLEFQINTTITQSNLHQLMDIYQMAVSIGAASFHPFLLVPTGRAGELVNEMLSPVEYEAVLNHIYDIHAQSTIAVKPTCAPQYHRIVHEREKAHSKRGFTGGISGLDTLSGGCLGGQGFAFISHTGDVQICGFMDEKAGDLRETEYDFEHIWRTSPLFNRVRSQLHYHGKCAVCTYWSMCGGCRARAYAIHGDYMAADPQCRYNGRLTCQ